MSGSGSAFGVVGRGRADFRRGDGGEGVGRTCSVCFSAFVPLVSCSLVFASAVFCSLISFCDHGAYTHRSRVGSTSALHASRAQHMRSGRTGCTRALCVLMC